MPSEAIESLLDSIYAAGEDPRQWENVLATLTNHVSGAGAALHAGTRDGTGFSFGTQFNVDPEALRAYAEYYYSVNPLHFALARVPVGKAVPDHELVPPREVMRTEFCDYARRYGISGSITLVVARNSRHEACLGIVRRIDADLFSLEQVGFVQRLGPHILRAVSLNRRLAALQAERQTFENALDRMETAVLLLNEKGGICYCNEAGTELLKKREGVIVAAGRLSAMDPATQTHLAGAIRIAIAAKGARGGSVLLPRQHPARPLAAKIMPFGQQNNFWQAGYDARAIVFISDPAGPGGTSVEDVMDSYGLTPSEKMLMTKLLAGSTLREAADDLNIAHATSRNRLARIMAKTDTHRQSELVQLMLRSSAPAR
jgi:DNA-binding CsgD family transcriptional regulator/PAS domain-containing protein